MRAIGYFTFDPRTRKGAWAYQNRYLAFREFCEEGRHADGRVFADPKGKEGQDGWRELLAYIRESELAYLVAIPNAQALGPSLEEQVARILQTDALNSRLVCTDKDYPDPLQSALRGAGAGRGDRIRAGMMAKAAKGRGLGRPPYGYRLLVGGRFEIVPEEAEVVRLIFDEYIECDCGVRVVAAALNERGLRTRAGKQWSMVGVRDILCNSAYIGTYRRFGLRIPGSCEPIVSPEQFRKAQERLAGHSPRRARPRRASFLLGGLLFCGHCGSTMMGVTRKQTWTLKSGRPAHGEYYYYQCQSRINRNACGYRTVRAETVEQQVVDIARRRLIDRYEQDARYESDSAAAPSWLERDRAQCDAKLRAIHKRFLDGVQRASEGKLTLGQLRVGSERLRAARESIDLRLSAMSDPAAAKRIFDANAARLIHEWHSLPHEERRDLLRLLIEKATLKNERVDVVLA